MNLHYNDKTVSGLECIIFIIEIPKHENVSLTLKCDPGTWIQETIHAMLFISAIIILKSDSRFYKANRALGAIF